MGYLPRVLFFNAFQLGTESENQVFPREEASKKQFVVIIVSNGFFILFLGKCSIPFLSGNWYLMFPSFISIIAPTVLRKGLPKTSVRKQVNDKNKIISEETCYQHKLDQHSNVKHVKLRSNHSRQRFTNDINQEITKQVN